MTTDEFITKYNNKGIDFDNYYGFQCMDLYRQYVKEVPDLPQSPAVAGAKDVWTTYLKDKYDRFENTPSAVPIKGDIIIWGTGAGPYGHIAVCTEANVNDFKSFDQNWPVNSLCHIQPHNYTNVLGWLRAKPVVVPPAPQTPVKIDLGEPYGMQEVQAIKSMLNDKDADIINLRNKMEDRKVYETEIELKLSIEEVKVKELNALLDKIESVAKGKGWTWTKLNKIKELLA